MTTLQLYVSSDYQIWVLPYLGEHPENNIKIIEIEQMTEDVKSFGGC